MVPPAGIEPALPKERDFESRASTNSTRGAEGIAATIVRTRQGSIQIPTKMTTIFFTDQNERAKQLSAVNGDHHDPQNV